MTQLKEIYQIVLEVPVEYLIKAKVAAEGAMRSGSDSASDPAGSPMFGAVQKLSDREQFSAVGCHCDLSCRAIKQAKPQFALQFANQ